MFSCSLQPLPAIAPDSSDGGIRHPEPLCDRTARRPPIVGCVWELAEVANTVHGDNNRAVAKGLFATVTTIRGGLAVTRRDIQTPCDQRRGDPFVALGDDQRAWWPIPKPFQQGVDDLPSQQVFSGGLDVGRPPLKRGFRYVILVFLRG